MPRLYQPLWETLKANKSVVISIHPSLHARTIKAVMKERTQDEGFKFQLVENSQRCWIRYRREGWLIHFHLDFSIGESDV